VIEGRTVWGGTELEGLGIGFYMGMKGGLESVDEGSVSSVTSLDMGMTQ